MKPVISEGGSSVQLIATAISPDRARILGADDREWLQENLRSGPTTSATLLEQECRNEQEGSAQVHCLEPRHMGLGYSHPTFPVRSLGDGTPAAYSQFMALAKIFGEELTKDACRLSVGQDMMRFLTTFIAALRGTTEHHRQDFFITCY